LTQFILNDRLVSTDMPPGKVILDFIRYHQHLPGTKIGCREGDCGACTVLVGELKDEELKYISMTSCLMPLANAHGRHIVTIEGINLPDRLNKIQQAMADQGATQCGFCTPGFVVSLAGACLQQNITDPVTAIDGNICRCTGYKSIARAANTIHQLLLKRNGQAAIDFAVKEELLPSYFLDIKKRLSGISIPPNIREQDLPIVGGGTDLYVQKEEEVSERINRYVLNNKEQHLIREEKDRIIIGPSVTVTDLRESSLFNRAFPSFLACSKLVSSTPIRNMATLAGNFVNASPIGDMTIIFLALGTELELSGGKTTRTVPLHSFYKGYKQLEKLPHEWISAITIPKLRGKYHFNFEKVSKRTHLDIATVNTAILVEENGDVLSKVAISAGGIGPVPSLLKATSAQFENKRLSIELLDAALANIKNEIAPISDARGSSRYKTQLLLQLVKAHFHTLFPGVFSEDAVLSLT
jgi:xanthine dehydrogenase small subunit